MKPHWQAWLATALEEGPAAHGWTEDQRWTLPRIAVLVARRFHVRFSPSQLSRILHEMGFSVQVPVHRAVERDLQAVERWTAEVWPEVEKAVREQDAWLVFEDEAGQSLRPPKARTWSCRGRAPVVKVTGKGSGRVSLAGLVCTRPRDPRARLIYRMLVHTGRKGERKGFREDDYAALLDAAHHQLGGNIVLVWDNATQHKDAVMRELIEARSAWLTVFRLPPYTPDLNPAEGVWAHLKKSLANLAACTIRQLAAKARTRLKKMQYRPDLLNGFIRETGLIFTSP
ncbi:IS630 family transposase [Streptomyces sp. NBC_00233]|uniref:IS630 family transposase n=1 Tax=Streptomyces sp. NBC_00233 TaxID=2975686 RepID=UPI00225BA6E2|nr:IS630 family transposase [Streptomyces sp. NBC_00233]MCX5233216.1 IS630 family transposase [Streptomyces sp. NBC_00233]